MDAYVLNLDSRSDRWKAIQRRFKDSPLRLHRFPATPHPNGGLGIFYSTIKILKFAKKKGLANILILEDDCIPAPGWKTQWPIIRAWLSDHPDLWDIYSGGAWGGNDTFQTITSSLGLEPTEIGRSNQIIFFQYPVVAHGAHWLYIPQRSYTPLINHYKRFIFLKKIIPYFGPDVLNNWFKVVTSYPFLAYQASSYSNIETQFVPRETRLKRYEARVKRSLTRKKRKV